MTPTDKKGALLIAAILLSGPLAFWLFLIVFSSLDAAPDAGHTAILIGAILIWLTHMTWWTRTFFKLAKRDLRRGFPVDPAKPPPHR